MDRRAFISGITLSLLAAPLAAEAQGGYKPEFKLSVVVNEDTAWGRAAIRFADAVRSRTQDASRLSHTSTGGNRARTGVVHHHHRARDRRLSQGGTL